MLKNAEIDSKSKSKHKTPTNIQQIQEIKKKNILLNKRPCSCVVDTHK